MKKNKILALILTFLMIFPLAACGGEKDSGDPNLVTIGDYQALHTGSKIVQDYDGNDCIAITYQYTNNSKEAESFEWSFYYTVKQGDAELEYAPVFVSEDSYDMLDDGLSEEVNPGETKEVTMTYMLNDLTTPVVLEFSDLLGDETDTLSVDVATLEK